MLPGGQHRSGGRRLVVLRHGETTHNATGVWQGQLDSPLSARGRAQAAAVGPALAAYRPTRVVSSDLQRAALTADAVAASLEIPVSYDVRLREIHAGQWQGLTNAEIEARWPQERAAVLRGEDIRRGGPTGETMAEVRERGLACVGDVLATMDPGECVVLSTHGACGKTLAGALLGLDLETSWRLLGSLGNCHVGVLVEGDQGWFVRAWNLGAADSADGGSSPP